MNDFREELIEIRNDYIRIFSQINIGEYSLSIQASDMHYCTPRETFEDIYKYDSMEVAVFKNDEWCDIEQDEEFDCWKYKTYFLESYDGMVASRIDIDVIQSLYEYLIDKES